MADDARLERIERKLDEVGQAIVALARVEERLVTLFKRMDSMDAEQRAQGVRLAEVEQNSGSNGQMLRFVERIFWIILAASVTFAFNKAKGG